MSESHPEHTQEMDNIIYLQGAAHFYTDDKKLLDAFCKTKRDQGYWVLV